jgi:hypothetical protein
METYEKGHSRIRAPGNTRINRQSLLFAVAAAPAALLLRTQDAPSLSSSAQAHDKTEMEAR